MKLVESLSSLSMAATDPFEIKKKKQLKKKFSF